MTAAPALVGAGGARLEGGARRDPRLRRVEWRDLTGLHRWEIARELTLPLPALVASLALVEQGLLLAALAASFVFFLCGLRVVHNAFHHALGIPRAGDDLVLLVLSVLMLGSMHAVRFNHQRHHRDSLGPEDVEGVGARGPAWRAVLLGPRFPWLLHRTALRLAPRATRRWIRAELVANALFCGAVVALWEVPALRYHLLAMAVGQCLTAFFAVWTVHHDCGPHPWLARTIRRRALSLATAHMFFHLEHHLFPAVPTCHLPELARRVDREAPGLSSHLVL